ncbi:hypothetical protein ACFVWN_07925 [Nocardiopsis flavescens]|uniref:hypothetical protein n=1 Tax=Nocardiopsis flavescens TaxID=758803 RepID=UPI0036517A64
MSDSEVSLTKVEEDVLISLAALEYENKPTVNFFWPSEIGGYSDLTTDVDAIGEALATLTEKDLVSGFQGRYCLGPDSSSVVRKVKNRRGES